MKQFKLKVSDLFDSMLRALHHHGGTSTVSEIENFVIKDLGLSEDEIIDKHRGTVTKLHYKLRWARTKLKNYGLLESSKRGVWSLTPKGQKVKSVNPKQVVAH
jgi:restriction system protein